MISWLLSKRHLVVKFWTNSFTYLFCCHEAFLWVIQSRHEGRMVNGWFSSGKFRGETLVSIWKNVSIYAKRFVTILFPKNPIFNCRLYKGSPRNPSIIHCVSCSDCSWLFLGPWEWIGLFSQKKSNLLQV